VASRCGTNFLAAMLELYPGLTLSPNQINESHFLTPAHHLMNYGDAFFHAYPKNADRIGRYDFLTLFGSSFLAYLHSYTPTGERMLVKVATVKHLRYFPIVFPLEHLLMVLRDGRDVVCSTMKTWPNSDFKEICHRWNNGAKLMIDFYDYYKGRQSYWMVKYEDVLSEPRKFIEQACDRFGLDINKFPFDKIQSLPVIGSSVHSRNGGKVAWNPIEKPKKFNPVGRWKAWTEKQKSTFKKIAGELLIRTGYESDFNW
jgi:protein-tyrosine sulfotransferase